MNTETRMRGACFAPSGAGTRPGFTVVKRKTPSALLGTRAKPRKPGVRTCPSCRPGRPDARTCRLRPPAKFRAGRRSLAHRRRPKRGPRRRCGGQLHSHRRPDRLTAGVGRCEVGTGGLRNGRLKGCGCVFIRHGQGSPWVSNSVRATRCRNGSRGPLRSGGLPVESAISRSRARSSDTQVYIGSASSNGSPGKYICVTSRVRKDGPNSEKWMCEGRHALWWLRQGYAPGRMVTKP